MLTLLTRLCWITLPGEEPWQDSPAFESRVKLLHGFKRVFLAGYTLSWFIPWNTTDKVWFILKSFLFKPTALVTWPVLKCAGVLEIPTDVCLLPFLKSEVWEWNQKQWLPKSVSKYIFSLLPLCPSAVDEATQGAGQLGTAMTLPFRGSKAGHFGECLGFVYVKNIVHLTFPRSFCLFPSMVLFGNRVRALLRPLNRRQTAGNDEVLHYTL